MNQYFQKIFTCSQVGAGKSRPDIYFAASRYLGTEPRETYVFEDVLMPSRRRIKPASRRWAYTIDSAN
ncbi:hypothetical protein NE575_19095 [Clostridium sp. SL.3.18]|nr:hypothetical protein [Clostridium sp. SL.3.18]